MNKWRKISISVLLTVFFLIVIGYFGLKSVTYQPSQLAQEAAGSSSGINVSQSKDGLIFSPEKPTTKPAILFYQGALVEEMSYSLWAKTLAEAGYPVYLIHLPLNLAVFQGNKVEEIIEEFYLDNYVLGGHSLGAVMISRYAHRDTSENLKGVFFLASYPDEKGALNQLGKPVLSLTASEDGVLNQKNYEASRMFLPKETEFREIVGGNHAGFGSYGPQKGDNPSQLTEKEQQDLVADELLSWLERL
ncbi:alpha/beta hydrolase [Vagococcus salmoninarum]|uniref:alpha/beta hydrolase n=1 Tax=Vagococcus salmoninarum TaxID=2739 RepID=UPI00187E9DBE|nr:alpha/beta hydrolase [Vagococcus salmoninarum]MBE9387611.1 alpha/beta hydrolase [Vagococcus salmoninarum]